MWYKCLTVTILDQRISRLICYNPWIYPFRLQWAKWWKVMGVQCKIVWFILLVYEKINGGGDLHEFMAKQTSDTSRNMSFGVQYKFILY